MVAMVVIAIIVAVVADRYNLGVLIWIVLLFAITLWFIITPYKFTDDV